MRFYGTDGLPPKNVRLLKDADIDEKMIKPSCGESRGMILREFSDNVGGGRAVVCVKVYVDDHAKIPNSFQSKLCGNVGLTVSVEHVVGDVVARFLVDFYKLLLEDEADMLVMSLDGGAVLFDEVKIKMLMFEAAHAPHKRA